jgi:tRNA(Ile)-lysidine synthase
MVLDVLSRAVRDLRLGGQHVLIAVSGGVDSTVLLEGMHRVASAEGLKLSVAHINHGLRGEESDGDERFVSLRAAEMGLRFSSARVDPRSLREGGTKRARPTLQEAARTCRYRALETIAEEHAADCIATAHTLDDQAETVLMRLLRGASPSALGGIPERSREGGVVRPLLAASRAEIEAFARSEGLDWREDSSNASDAYTRNRLRRHWIPGLAEEFNPQLLRAVARLAESQRRDSEWIDELVELKAGELWGIKDHDDAEGRMSGRGLELVEEGWAELPEALALRLAARAMRELGAGRDISRVHLVRLWRFLAAENLYTGAELELPGGLRLIKARGVFRMGRVEVDAKGSC